MKSNKIISNWISLKVPPEGKGARHGGAFPAGKDYIIKRGGD
jgi:hypothetical protein